MRKRINLLAICILLLLAGCSSGDNNEGVMNPPGDSNNPGDGGGNEIPPAPVSYQDDIRVIIQNNCTACHSDPPVRNAPMSLTTRLDVKSAVESRGLLTRINSTSNPMPPEGRMPAATRQLIEDWVDLGFPE